MNILVLVETYRVGQLVSNINMFYFFHSLSFFCVVQARRIRIESPGRLRTKSSTGSSLMWSVTHMCTEITLKLIQRCIFLWRIYKKKKKKSLYSAPQCGLANAWELMWLRHLHLFPVKKWGGLLRNAACFLLRGGFYGCHPVKVPWVDGRDRGGRGRGLWEDSIRAHRRHVCIRGVQGMCAGRYHM